MRPRRSTRNAGGSGGSCDGGVNENGDSSPCQAGGEMDESIVLDAKNLLEMLGASSPVPGEEGSGEEEEEEGDEEEDEKLDLVMALDGRFRSVDLKRKFSESVLQISGGGVLRDETAGSPVASHVARSSSGDGSGSTDSREGRSSSGSGSYSGCVDGSMPEAGESDNVALSDLVGTVVSGVLLLSLLLLLRVERECWFCQEVVAIAIYLGGHACAISRYHDHAHAILLL